MIFNGEGHELQYCQLPTFRGPPGALNNDRSLSIINAFCTREGTRGDGKKSQINNRGATIIPDIRVVLVGEIVAAWVRNALNQPHVSTLGKKL